MVRCSTLLRPPSPGSVVRSAWRRSRRPSGYEWLGSIRAELAPALASVLTPQSVDEVTDPIGDDSSDADDDTVLGVQPVGRVSYDHVRSIHRTLRALPPSERDRASETLTGLAPQLGVDDLRATGRYLRHVIDPDGSARQGEEDYGRRWLSLAPDA